MGSVRPFDDIISDGAANNNALDTWFRNDNRARCFSCLGANRASPLFLLAGLPSAKVETTGLVRGPDPSAAPDRALMVSAAPTSRRIHLRGVVSVLL